MKEAVIIASALLLAGSLLVMFVWFLIWDNENDNKRYDATCKYMASLAGSKEYKSLGYGECLFVKDGKLKEVSY